MNSPKPVNLNDPEIFKSTINNLLEKNMNLGAEINRLRAELETKDAEIAALTKQLEAEQ